MKAGLSSIKVVRLQRTAAGIALLVFLILIIFGPGLFPVALSQESDNIAHVIFDEKWRNEWVDESVKAETDPKYNEWIRTGIFGLAVKLEKGGELVCGRQAAILVDDYSGITGYINGGENGGQMIGISVIDHNGKRIPKEKPYDLRKYILGGKLPADDWKPFAVPLSLFGASLKRGIKGICLVNAQGEAINEFYLDDFGLIKGKVPKYASIKETKTTFPRKTPLLFSYIYHDRLEGNWQNWSWGGCHLQPYSKSAAKGKRSLGVRQPKGSALAFGRHNPVSTIEYNRLEFQVSGPNPQLKVLIFDDNGREMENGSVNINDKKYVNEGSFNSDEWKAVSIPLADLKAENILIMKIAVINNSDEDQIFLIDEVMLTE